jgi:hypothetical protein
MYLLYSLLWYQSIILRKAEPTTPSLQSRCARVAGEHSGVTDPDRKLLLQEQFT